MLLYPSVPLSPVTMKDKVVVDWDWFVIIEMLDICEPDMFPLISRLIIAPLSVVAAMVIVEVVGVGDGALVGVGVVVGVGEIIGVCVGGGVVVEVCVGEGVKVGV
jgi:hypothetical protein